MQAQFFFHAGANDIVGPVKTAIFLYTYLWHDKQGNASHARGCALNPRQYQVNNVLGQVMVSQEIKIFEPLMRKAFPSGMAVV